MITKVMANSGYRLSATSCTSKEIIQKFPDFVAYRKAITQEKRDLVDQSFELVEHGIEMTDQLKEELEKKKLEQLYLFSSFVATGIIHPRLMIFICFVIR